MGSGLRGADICFLFYERVIWEMNGPDGRVVIARATATRAAKATGMWPDALQAAMTCGEQ